MTATTAARAHRGSILLREAEVLAVDRHPGEQCVMRLAEPDIAARAEPGSFVHLRCDPLLPLRRPMSIMRTGEGWFDMLFKIHGHGTALLAAREPGERVSVLGPIGRTFPLEGYSRRPLLIGGGVGIPPMVFLAEHLRRTAPESEPLVLMGSEVPFPFSMRPSTIMVPGVPANTIAAMPLLEDWGIVSRLASGQGLPGCFDGFVTELADAWLEANAGVRDEIQVFACGPTPMLVAVQALARRHGVSAWLSLEEYMACAVGGCAGCTVRIEDANGPAMRRVCVDGPVFAAETIAFAHG